MFIKKNVSVLTIIFVICLPIIPSVAHEKFKVITTFTIIADIAQNIAGEAAIVESITKPGADIHTYQATPGDIQKLEKAQLILWNGLGLEIWFHKFFTNLKDLPNVIISKGIQPISIIEGPYKGKPNPHAWMSPNLSTIYINNIRDAFIKYDPENRIIYQKNAEIYKLKIKNIVSPIKEKISSIPENKRWLVSSEGAFSYLARDFNLKELYLWPINSDQQGTPQQVKKVIDTIRKNNIPVIFSESTVSPKPAEEVARETGAKYGNILYVDSLSEKTGPVPTYLDLLKMTLNTITDGLMQEKDK
ncbi:MAG: manganese/iron transport system substrate-binding protein [Candidatus Tokpelaia sp. JSC161]|jgi:manganese/iron transport system substrate-binding protein|nr:MAG: manganese/iron transport system substrate-binding protein [Candidatus Tokpelaia sp. JSC161]